MREVLGQLRVPVVAAPMFLITGPDLVIAAGRAGALGAFPAPNARTVDDLDEWMSTIRTGLRTSNGATLPWAVNLVTHRTNDRLAADLKVVAEHRPPVVITALGSPKPVMEVVKGYGGLVIADVVSVGLAQKAVAAGVDGLACICAGAGGHTGHLSPFAFISAVREFFDGIIAVGGGISDGYGVAGAVTAGADLVYVGTRFLATTESLAVQEYKQMVVDHGLDDLIVSSAVTGTDASWLRPSLAANGYDPGDMGAPAIRSYNSGSDAGHKRWKDIWAAGQGLQTIHGIEPAAAVVDRLEREYREAMTRRMTLQTRGAPAT
ncbi:NAD(P)H-dependent flavin oxidoreductase [Rudaeicoccus suwonensis]|uniref:NAD(P)H-dependent flavin oxidoreductase n=1 Tax=Rudaeicoccus suwonensis TaxID=657409 RepID=UPI001FE8B637|nr:nitronate monooxygenase [Rudaeicoccus suwonensis]